jgi:hypothetical protein
MTDPTPSVFAAAIERIKAEAATVAEKIRRDTAARDALTATIAIAQAKLDAFTSTIASLEACGSIGQPRERAPRLDIAEAILTDLREAPHGRDLAGICVVLSRKPSLVGPALKRLLSTTKIVEADGIYRITPE